MQFSNLTAFVAVLSLASGITAWETLPDGTVVATDIEYTRADSTYLIKNKSLTYTFSETVHEPCLFPHTQDRRAVGDACTVSSCHVEQGARTNDVTVPR